MVYTHRYYVHPADAGFVVGRKGQTIQRIARSTGSHIQLYPAPTNAHIIKNPNLRPYPFFWIQSMSPYMISNIVSMIAGIAKESENRRYGIFHQGAKTRPRERLNVIQNADDPLIVEFSSDEESDDDEEEAA